MPVVRYRTIVLSSPRYAPVIKKHRDLFATARVCTGSQVLQAFLAPAVKCRDVLLSSPKYAPVARYRVIFCTDGQVA